MKRSHCELCDHELTWWELIPVFGYLINIGKCSHCKNRVNPYYPASELLLGISTLLFVLYTIPFYYYIVLLFLFILSYYDHKDMGIPKTLTHIFLALCFVTFSYLLIISEASFTNLIAPIVVTAIIVGLNLIKKSFGLGDILVMLGIGILLTVKQYISFFWISIVIALLYAVIISLIERKNLRKMKIPMVPFLSIAFVGTVIYGEMIGTLLLNLMRI